MGHKSKHRRDVKANTSGSWQNILTGAILRIVGCVLIVLGFGLEIWKVAMAEDGTWWSIEHIIKLVAAIIFLISSVFIVIGILQDPKL